MAGRNDTAVVKIGTSSITDDEGIIDRAMVASCATRWPPCGPQADGWSW